MDFKQLEPIFIRPECDPNYDRQLWQPDWRCYCCQDTGFVIDRLAAHVIRGYNSTYHRLVKCQATGCGIYVGETLETSGSLDRRLTPEICDYFDRNERLSWRQTLDEQRKLKQKTIEMVDELAQKKSMCLDKRTSDETMEVENKHQKIING